MKAISTKISKGFALPTVIITSVVMMIVLLAGLSSLTSISTTLDNQRHGQLAREAAQAGLKLAQRCIDLGAVNWSDASPLRPGRGCSGGTQGNTANTNVLFDTALNQRTTFTVGLPVAQPSGGYLIHATGTYITTRSGTSVAAKNVNVGVSLKYTLDSFSVASISSSGNALVCGVIKPLGTTKSQAYCWGQNKDGRTGPGVFDSTVSYCTNAPHNITYTAERDGSDCIPAYKAVKRDETGALFNTSGTDMSIPRSRVLRDHEIDIGAGGGFACTISTNAADDLTSRKVFCWGSDDKGRLGAGGDIRASGSVNCKSVESSPEDDEDSSANVIACSSPVQVQNAWLTGDPGYYPTNIAVGKSHACALVKPSPAADSTTGHVYCWGQRGMSGRLGDGTTGGYSHTPVRVIGPTGVGAFNAKSIYIGNGPTTCGINPNNKAFCWGDDAFLQLGNGSGANAGGSATHNEYPQAVEVYLGANPPQELTATKVISHGNAQNSDGAPGSQSCGIGRDGSAVGSPDVLAGKVYCWGDDNFGAVGQANTPRAGDYARANLVDRVYNNNGESTTNYTAYDVAVAIRSSCAVINATFTSGTGNGVGVYCWGSNSQGALGIGPTTTPSPCPDGNAALAVNNYLQCSVDNSDNTTASSHAIRTRPMPVDNSVGAPITSSTKIVGGAHRFCMIAGINNYCWGRNHVGQVGDGTIVNPRWIPKPSEFLNVSGEKVFF